MKEIKIGVIGLGVGERHVVGYSQVPGVQVTGVCDFDEQRLHEAADRQNVPDRYTDYRKLLEDPSIDAVSICSHDDYHADQVVEAFAAGKHVMVEKPTTLNRADLDRVIRAQQDSGKRISSNLILRQSPRFIKIREMVRNGDFGELVYLEGDYLHNVLWKILDDWRGRMDFYCVTYGGGIHLIDLMRWISGEEIVEVTGMGAKKVTRGTDFQYPDTISNLLRFESDALGKTTTTFGAARHKFHALNIYGTDMSFENGKPDGRLFTGNRRFGADPFLEEEVVEEPFTVPYPAVEKGDLLPDFIDAIRNDREPNVGAKDIYRVMEICFACWESVQNRRNVDVTYTL